ncbi:MAG: diphosphomevalonate decarboxylase [Chloroflexota bacterium]|nr:diphosphomevalonate decarboxylase [Chloroflexota bacterium]
MALYIVHLLLRDPPALLNSITIIDERSDEIEAFCAQIHSGLNNAYFEDELQLLDLLDVHGKLAVEDGAYIMQTDNRTATAVACANIAFIKYWGNCDPDSRIPANGSISMNLAGLETRTSVTFDGSLGRDSLVIGGETAPDQARERVGRFMDHVRVLAGIDQFARVESENNFPMGVGIASSASAFAALALAASRAAGLYLPEIELSRLAMIGSGSACRSIPGGFVEWVVEGCSQNSAGISIASPEHWYLVDCVAIISRDHKPVGSIEGHALAYTSPLQDARVGDAPRRLGLCRSAILHRDFETLAAVIELDSNMMHAVMMTSRPSLVYWQPATLMLMREVAAWRRAGLPVCYTVDAGPNVHVITLSGCEERVLERIQSLPGVLDVLTARPGGPARVLGDKG